MTNKIRIEWALELPQTGLKENSIYIIDPKTGIIPAVYVTNNTGSNAFRINPTTDLTSYLKFVNDISPNINGNIDLDLTYNNGVLSITGSDISFNLAADFVSLSTFNQYTTLTNNRLESIEYAVTEGLKTPLPFNSTLYPIFPSKTKGTTYKVTVAGTTSDINLEIGDTIIYDTTGDNPFVIQANVDVATITIPGLIALASQQEVDEFLIDNKAITPLTFGTKLIRELKGPDGWNIINLTGLTENTILMDGNKGKNFMITFDNLVIGNTCKIQKIRQNKVEASFWEGSEFWVKNNNTVGNLQFENTSLLPNYGTIENITFGETIILKPQTWIKMIIRNGLVYAINLSIEPTDTLQSVTTRGNVISNKIRFASPGYNGTNYSERGDIFYDSEKLNWSLGDRNPLATGGSNVIIGAYTFFRATGASSNTIVGNNSGAYIFGANNNSIFGYDSGNGISNGKFNSIFGNEAFRGNDGSFNSVFGHRSGSSGNRNTILGSYAGAGTTSMTNIMTNSILIGIGSGGGEALTNKLVIHSNTTFNDNNGNITFTNIAESRLANALITGDFLEKWVKLNGKLVINPTFISNKSGNVGMLVVDATGEVGVSYGGLTLMSNFKLTLSGYKYTIEGLEDKSNDSTYNRFLISNSAGDVATTNGISLMMNLPDTMTNTQKATWGSKMNGGYGNSTMNIDFIHPSVVDINDRDYYIKIKGTNLNLNPTNFAVELCTDTSTSGNVTVVQGIPGSKVQISTNGTDLLFSFNFKDIPIGNYKLRIFNGVSYYLTTLQLSVVNLMQRVDLSGITWTKKVLNDLTSDRYTEGGNSVYYTVDNATIAGNANDGRYLVARKTNQLIGDNEDFIMNCIITGNTPFYDSATTMGQSIGLIPSNTILALADQTITKVKVNNFTRVPQNQFFVDENTLNVLNSTVTYIINVDFMRKGNIWTTILRLNEDVIWSVKTGYTGPISFAMYNQNTISMININATITELFKI